MPGKYHLLLKTVSIFFFKYLLTGSFRILLLYLDREDYKEELACLGHNANWIVPPCVVWFTKEARLGRSCGCLLRSLCPSHETCGLLWKSFAISLSWISLKRMGISFRRFLGQWRRVNHEEGKREFSLNWSRRSWFAFHCETRQGLGIWFGT